MTKGLIITDDAPRRGQIHGLSKSSRRRPRNQARTLIPTQCIDQSVAVTLRFRHGTVTEGIEAEKAFKALFVRLERWAHKHDAAVGGFRSIEKAKKEETVHVHGWIWISRPELLADLASEIETRWPPRVGFKRAHPKIVKVDFVHTEDFLWATIEYIMKQRGKEDITGVRPVACIRKAVLPIAEPKTIEVDVSQAQWIKTDANRLMRRVNFPEPRKMVFNLQEPDHGNLLRDSYKARQGPTPAELFDLKVGEA